MPRHGVFVEAAGADAAVERRYRLAEWTEGPLQGGFRLRRQRAQHYSRPQISSSQAERRPAARRRATFIPITLGPRTP
jgi:hypothetical protein